MHHVPMETSRQDVRLETFLCRNLSPEDYERVCASEPCVVFTPEEKRVYRYAVLGHHKLYTLDFPPKKLRTVLELKSISSMRTVRE